TTPPAPSRARDSAAPRTESSRPRPTNTAPRYPKPRFPCDRCRALPRDGVCTHGLCEALQRDVADVVEADVLAQVHHARGYERLRRVGARAETRGELHRRAEEISLALDRLARGGADTNAHRLAGDRSRGGELGVHHRRATHRELRRSEHRHDPVAEMFHL